jgi:hypothetical protein
MSQRRERLVIEALGDGERHWDLRILSQPSRQILDDRESHRKCFPV